VHPNCGPAAARWRREETGVKALGSGGAAAWSKAAAASAILGMTALTCFAGRAEAQAPPAVGRPVDTAIDLQGAATAVSDDIHHFHAFVLAIITAITILILALLLWIIVRYNRKANPVPKKFTHNAFVEIVWTVVPVIILVLIAIKSFPLLSEEEHVPKAALTIKAIGNAWFWSYEYPDLGVTFDANVLTKAEADKQGKPYLLATDEAIVVPEKTIVKVLMTSNDVIHSWAVPSFGVKQDAIPGRINEGWFKVDTPGVYYGQCSELCGIKHGFMPIEVHVVPRPEFDAWVASKGGKLAASSAPAGAAPAPSTPAPATPAPSGAPAGKPAR
jgi:cytochrome c oxidase subunit 2